MANNDLKKFQELLMSDTEFQEEFRKAAEKYSGEPDLKAVFENLLLPFAQEHGLSATFEEFREYAGALIGGADEELSEDELAQIAGGKNDDFAICIGIGAGDLFGTGQGYACQAVGYAPGCFFIGESDDKVNKIF